ncbi:hypothetical protein DYU11_07985 [Fibrisoma montanum]|uniref:DUF3575 domain-containing protein n=1 Tax=Fibrisoma montanum TaxID=2305895 RepID=A0A418MEL4_9BACT|nr:hypothetical protein [Fibrisoma montanum]RIV25238.1 hypothetical protein DYU11_07985 [Fibrisoma montanum]
MKQLLHSALLFLLFNTVGQAQDMFLKEGRATYQTNAKGHWMAGGGLTFIGVTGKAGRFVADHVWLGGELEHLSFFGTRYEAGVFARYYKGKGMLNGILGTGVTYGQFKGWTFDGPMPPAYRSVKLNALLGLELRLTERVSFEGVAKIGWLTAAQCVQFSPQGSLNVYLGR